MPKQLVPVIGVFYSESDYLEDWVKCVGAQSTDDISVIPIIVTNYHKTKSKHLEGQVARLKETTEHPLEIHTLQDNRGHSFAFNRGIEFVTKELPDAEWIVSLDPDARLADRCIELMLNAAHTKQDCGMVTPMVLQCKRDSAELAKLWRAAVSEKMKVLHAGHYPKRVDLPKNNFPVYWHSYFDGKPLDDARTRAKTENVFTPCFCAGLWSKRMIDHIGLIDERQPRTLNCGEYGYHANLRGYTCELAADAVAFHPRDCTKFWKTQVFDEERASGVEGNATRFQHAQGLIAMKYFPDANRLTCMTSDSRSTTWPQ